jgi:hypothetical protein
MEIHNLGSYPSFISPITYDLEGSFILLLLFRVGANEECDIATGYSCVAGLFAMIFFELIIEI